MDSPNTAPNIMNYSGVTGLPLVISNCHFNNLRNLGFMLDNFENASEDFKLYVEWLDNVFENSFNDDIAMFRCDSNSNVVVRDSSFVENVATSF